MVAIVHRTECQRGDNCTERTLESAEVPLEIIPCVDQYTCVRKLPEAMERAKPRILPMITKLENLAWFMGHWVEYPQRSCLRSREYLVQDEHFCLTQKKSWKQSWKGSDCFQLNQLCPQIKSKNIYMNALTPPKNPVPTKVTFIIFASIKNYQAWKWQCESVSRSVVTPMTIAYQASLSMGFSRQEYWSGLPFPFPGDLSKPGIKPGSPALQADFLPSEPLGHLPITMLYVNYISIKKLPGIKTSSKNNYYNYILYVKKVKILTLQKR